MLRKGLDKVLTEIASQVPGARLENVSGRQKEKPPWETQERDILPVEKWIRIVQKDIQKAPTQMDRYTITGPHYTWHRDEWGRANVTALDWSGKVLPMFVEAWAGEPELGKRT